MPFPFFQGPASQAWSSEAGSAVGPWQAPSRTWALSPAPQQGHWGFWCGTGASTEAVVAAWGRVCPVACSHFAAQRGCPEHLLDKEPICPTSSESEPGWKGQVCLLQVTTGETKAKRSYQRRWDVVERVWALEANGYSFIQPSIHSLNKCWLRGCNVAGTQYWLNKQMTRRTGE